MARRRIATDKELYLLRQEGVSYRQMAQYYGLSENSIRGRVSRYKAKVAPDAEHIKDVKRAIAYEEEFAAELGIGNQWIKDHVHKGEPRRVELTYISRTGYKNPEQVLKRVFGSGIEDYQHIWYDEDDDLWYYGVEEVSP
jgi:transposase